MQKKRNHNYVYYCIQLILVGLTIMFICTHFAGVKSTEIFRESKANIWQCVYCLLFSFLPYILKRWNIHSTKTLQVYFLLAIIVHFIGGGTLHYYRDVWFFSFIVHLINSFLIATIIYGMLLRHCKNQSKLFMFLSTVAFTALIGVLWEVCEYAIDGMAGRNMQRFNDSITGEAFIGRRALQDTMIDLMMDTLGGLIAGLYFAYTKIKGVPLYKFLELKYVKADLNITYQDDETHYEQLAQARAEKKALKIVNKNEKRKTKLDKKQSNRLYKQEKRNLKNEQKLTKKKDQISNKAIKSANKKIKALDKNNKKTKQDKTENVNPTQDKE